MTPGSYLSLSRDLRRQAKPPATVEGLRLVFDDTTERADTPPCFAIRNLGTLMAASRVTLRVRPRLAGNSDKAR
jgi:hypothetical protein